MKVALSAGHGKRIGHAGIIVYDPGAVYYGIAEHDVCLGIVNMVFALCNKIPELELIEIPPDTLQEKVSFINAYGAEVAIELHLNSATDTKVRGTECLYYPGSAEGFKIALQLSKTISTNINTPNRGIKERPDLYFLRKTRCPAVVLEADFLSNKNFATEITEGFVRQKIAYALAYFMFLMSKGAV